jgi:hypothetical protein
MFVFFTSFNFSFGTATVTNPSFLASSPIIVKSQNKQHQKKKKNQKKKQN